MANLKKLGQLFLATLVIGVHPARAQDANSARVWIRSLYSAYTHGGKGIPYDEKNGGRWFDSSLLALMRADNNVVGHGYVSAYSDADVFCGCQDWDGIWELRVDVRTSGPHRVTADVSFALAHPATKDDERKIRFELVVERGQWRIDDICPNNGLCLRPAMEMEIRDLAAQSKSRPKSKE